MGIESFTSFELFQGFIGITQLTLNFILGLRIVSKYYTFKRIELITIGFMLVFLTSPWWGSGLSFLSLLFFNVNLSDTAYIVISYGLIPITSLLWMYSFGLLVYPHARRKIFFVYLAFNLVYLIIFFYLLNISPSLLAIRVSELDSETQLFVSSFVLITLAISLITNFLFMKNSLLSEDPRVRWKGKIIFMALSIYVIGAILDSVVSLTPITLIITRTILMLASVLSYIGWILPERIARILIRE